MKPKSSQTIVIVGYWNRMIFTPEWVTSHLLRDVEEVEIEVPLLPAGPLIYKLNEFYMEISGSRLVFRVNEFKPNALLRAQEVAVRALETLADTPIIGLGINFSFTENLISSQIRQLFRSTDDIPIASSGWQLNQPRIVRHLQRDRKILNMVMTLNSNYLEINHNYLYKMDRADGNKMALYHLNDGLENYWQCSLDFLRRVYKLELREV